MKKFIRRRFDLLSLWIASNFGTGETESLLKDIAKNQLRIIESQRRLSERLMLLEFRLRQSPAEHPQKL